MGYECPVCGTPQRDRRHLADHLAVTAMTHGDEHADWLAEHVPDWAGRSPHDLGDAVAEHAPEAEYDEVFEDTVDRPTDGHGHGHDHGRGDPGCHGGPTDPATVAEGVGAGETLTEADRAAIEEAREMTREMLAGDEDGDGGEASEEESEATDGDGTETATADGERSDTGGDDG